MDDQGRVLARGRYEGKTVRLAVDGMIARSVFANQSANACLLQYTQRSTAGQSGVRTSCDT